MFTRHPLSLTLDVAYTDGRDPDHIGHYRRPGGQCRVDDLIGHRCAGLAASAGTSPLSLAISSA
jgi:hypothetical protein